MENLALDNRRKERRVSADENIYVVLNIKPQMMGQMVEISSNGLAFTFVDLEAISQKIEEHSVLRMDLFKGGKGFFIRDLNCRLVSQINKQASTTIPSMKIKRIGVEFEDLTVSQQIQINALVRQQDYNNPINCRTQS